MTIAFDAFSESTSDDPSFTHTPAGTPAAVGIFLLQVGTATDEVTTVDYGTLSVEESEVALSPLLKATGEVGAVHAFFAGSSVPTGPQTVAVNTGTAANYHTVCVTLTAAGDMEVVDTTTLSSDALDEPSLNVSLPEDVVAFIFGALLSGVAAPSSLAPGTGYTTVTEVDMGAMSTSVIYRTDNATGGVGGSDEAVSWVTGGPADDVIAFGLAVKESAGAPATHRHHSLLTLGAG